MCPAPPPAPAPPPQALDILDNEEEIHVPRVLVYDHKASGISREAIHASLVDGRDVWWQDVIADILEEPAIRNAMDRILVDAHPMGSKEFAQQIVQDIARWKQVAASANVRLD